MYQWKGSHRSTSTSIHQRLRLDCISLGCRLRLLCDGTPSRSAHRSCWCAAMSSRPYAPPFLAPPSVADDMPSPSSASENAQADERVDTADATRHKRLARRRRDVPWPRKAHINCPCCRRCGVRGSLPPPRRDLLLSHMVLFFPSQVPLCLKGGAGVRGVPVRGL